MKQQHLFTTISKLISVQKKVQTILGTFTLCIGGEIKRIYVHIVIKQVSVESYYY